MRAVDVLAGSCNAMQCDAMPTPDHRSFSGVLGVKDAAYTVQCGRGRLEAKADLSFIVSGLVGREWKEGREDST